MYYGELENSQWLGDAVASLFACSSRANPRNCPVSGLPYNCHILIMRDVLLYFLTEKQTKTTRTRGLGIS